MSDWKQHLSDADLKEVRDTMIAAGTTTDALVDSLLLGISPQFAGNLATGGLPPNTKLWVHLRRMNEVPNLRNGDVPLGQWLDNALNLTVQDSHMTVIESALEKVGAEPQQPPGSVAAPDLASANLDIRPEAMIAGEENTLAVSYLQRALNATGSVCKILVHRHVDQEPDIGPNGEPRLSNGTAWFIGPRLVITNHHVVNSRRPALFGLAAEADASSDDFQKQAENAEILFDYFEKDSPPGDTAKTAAGALQVADKDLDFAILRLPDSAPARSPFRIRKNSIRKRVDQALGTRVNLLQHPGGKPMRLGFRDNFVVLGDDDILSYLTDTASGSSGSPVCDDTWKVAALHAGSRSVSADGLAIRGRKVKSENFGIPIQTILKKLQADHPALHAEIIDAQP